MYRLKIANASRNHASEFRTSAEARLAPSFVVSARIANIPSESQKPPYDANVVAPKTFRFLNSHIPASNWTSPP
jgi:hypothetical protein